MGRERAGGARGRRRLRLCGGVLVALVGVLTWDQGGLLAGASSSAPGELASAGRPNPSSRAGGFDALSTRLRLPEPSTVAVNAPAEATVVASPPPRVGDVAIAPPPPSFGGGAGATPPSPPAELRPSRYDASVAGAGTWALIIGIDDYPGTRYDLRSAVNDANDVNDALAKFGVTGDRRLVLRNDRADSGTIRAGLDWLGAHAGAESTMVLFYAGHVRRLGPGREAIVGSDGGVVPDTEVAAMLDRSPSRRGWVAIAGCYGGGFDEVVRPGRILTAASSADQVAYENEGFGRSYLVEYMVRRAMLTQGITTVEGAFSWATAALQRDYPDRLPYEIDQIGGELDLRAGGSASPAPAPSSPPPSNGGGGSSSGPPPSEPPPPASNDGCAALTVGMVRCQ